MDLDEAITVCKLDSQDGRYYLLIGWQSNSFEMYIFNKDKLWKGRFSHNRLAGFSKNLHMTEEAYYTSLRRCLTQHKEGYRYELKSGFFYWKQKYKNTFIIEGFLPVETIATPTNSQPDLVEILIALNRHLKEKVSNLQSSYKSIKTEYHLCLRDTEEFLNLKVDMEKALCDKFMNLLNIKKSKFKLVENDEVGISKKGPIPKTLK